MRESKNEKGSEWLVKEAAGHQMFTSCSLFCDKNRSSEGLETLFGIQDKRGPSRSDSPGGRRGRNPAAKTHFFLHR